MEFAKACPGARMIREPRPEYIDCPHCGQEVEIWSDELLARCPRCHRPVPRQRGASCLDWCAKARECVGEEAYRRLKGTGGNG